MNEEVDLFITNLTPFSGGTTYQLKEEGSWIEFKPPIERILWEMIINLRI